MNVKIFCVLDKKAEMYGNPFFMVNRASAIRAIQSQLTSDKSTMSQYPGDFALFELGDYDDSTGLLTGYAPIFIMDVLELAPSPSA